MRSNKIGGQLCSGISGKSKRSQPEEETILAGKEIWLRICCHTAY